jgi:hypothetical protein
MKSTLLIACLFAGLMADGREAWAQREGDPVDQIAQMERELDASLGRIHDPTQVLSPEEAARQKELAIQCAVQARIDGFLGKDNDAQFMTDKLSLRAEPDEVIAWLNTKIETLDKELDEAQRGQKGPESDLRLQLALYSIALCRLQWAHHDNLYGVDPIPTWELAKYYLGPEAASEPALMSELRNRIDVNEAYHQTQPPSHWRGQVCPMDVSRARVILARVRQRLHSAGNDPMSLENMDLQMELQNLELHLSEAERGYPGAWGYGDW